jgi:hypothetical protein
MSDGLKPSDITTVGPQATVKTVATPYLRRSDGAVGASLCPTAAVGHNAISDALPRRLKTVGDRLMSSDITYLRRSKAYV